MDVSQYEAVASQALTARAERELEGVVDMVMVGWGMGWSWFGRRFGLGVVV
jgi:hypothetical protein